MKSLFKKQTSPILYIGVVVVAVLLLIAGNKLTTKGAQIFGRLSSAEVVPARIDSLMGQEIKELNVGMEKQIYFEAEILQGEKKGQFISGRQIISTLSTVATREIKEGDRVILRYATYGESMSWVFQEYERSTPVFVLLTIFIGLLMLMGGKKGLGTIVSLVLTCACVFYYFLPAILSGQDIYLSTIIACTYIITITLLMINGFNYKSLSAGIGCFGGLMVAGILFKIMDVALHLTGVVDEESSYLMMMDVPIDLKAIIFSSILIGVLGGVLDIGVSIASSLSEVYPEGSTYTFKDVVRSGMNIGRDILCTTTNTLILVYIGSTLSSTLLFITYSNSFLELINREAILVEILQSLIGSIGLLFTIPLCTVCYAWGATHKKKKKEKSISGVNTPIEIPDPAPLKAKKRPKELIK